MKNCIPNLSINCKIKLKSIQTFGNLKIFPLYTVFQEASGEYSAAQEKGRHEFQKAKTPTHEDNEGKSRLTAMQLPREQLVQMETRGKMTSGGISQGGNLNCPSVQNCV